jgi:hypothetical protein
LDDSVVAFHPRHLDRLELEAARAEVGDRRVQIVDLEAGLRVRARRRTRRLEQRELARAELVEQSARPLLGGLEPELLGVERTGLVEGSHGDARRYPASVFEHGVSFVACKTQTPDTQRTNRR